MVTNTQVLIAVPEDWNKKFLVVAHGLRTENLPLTADINLTKKLYKQLLDVGWMIASTSYRRNGQIFLEAVEDLDYLREYIDVKYGKPQQAFIEGSSMGGAIVTLIVEMSKNKYDAASQQIGSV